MDAVCSRDGRKQKFKSFSIYEPAINYVCCLKQSRLSHILVETQFPERNIACGAGIGCDRNSYRSFRLDDCTYFLSELAFFRIDLCCLFAAPFASHFSWYITELQKLFTDDLTPNIQFYTRNFLQNKRKVVNIF